MSGLIGHVGLLLPGSASGPSFAAAVLALSPWGFWKLDETGTLTTATDYSGNARHGTYAGTGTTGSATSPYTSTSTAVTMNGSGRVDLPDWTLGTNQALTILACIRAIASSPPSAMHVISADDNLGARRRWQYRIGTGRKQDFVPWAGLSAGNSYPSSGPALGASGSNMIALVVDPSLSDAAGKFKFYTNGTLEHSSTQNAWAAAGLSKPAIGSRSSQLQAEGFIGTMGACALFTDALTPTDIANLWAARNTP